MGQFSSTGTCQPGNDGRVTVRADREDKVLLPFWATKAYRKRLKILAINEDCTQQELLAEALELLLKSRAVELDTPSEVEDMTLTASGISPGSSDEL